MRSVRLPSALIVAAAACLLTAGGALAGSPTPPEKTKGSVGEYYIRDGSASTAATCDYPDAGTLKLRKITVKAPEVRWPDTDSNVDHQYGKVRHRIVVQRSTNGGADWSKFKESAPQTKLAYEDAAAPLTKRTVTIASSSSTAMFRVLSKIEWIRPNGTVRGTLKHWYAYARWTSDQLQGSIETGNCDNLIND